MAEYMHFSHHKDRELDKTYKEYQTKHGKNYTSLTEHERRKHIFKHNLRCLYFKVALRFASIGLFQFLTSPIFLFHRLYFSMDITAALLLGDGSSIPRGGISEKGHLLKGGISQEVALLATRLGWYASTLVRGPSSCGSCPAIFV